MRAEGGPLRPAPRLIVCRFASRFEFSADLQLKLQSPAEVVGVFDEVRMQGDKGAVATVDLPAGNLSVF